MTETKENKSSEPVVKALVVGSRTEVNPSNQLEDIDKTDIETLIGEQTLRPPYDPAVLIQSTEENTRLSRSIRVWAKNTVAMGWRVVPQNAEGKILDLKELTDEQRKTFESEKLELQKLFTFPNSQMPFEEVMKRVKEDEEATGNGYLEVVRNMAGKITSLYHVPADTMRLLEDRSGFIQIEDMSSNAHYVPGDSARGISKKHYNIRYFKNFGDDRPMNADTGRRRANLSIKKRASEIIHFKISSPGHIHYGVPRWISAAPAIAGNRFAAERNVNFFKHDACPRLALLIENGQLSSDSVDDIQEFFQESAQGVENAHRLIVLQTEAQKTALTQEQSTSMKLEPLTVGVTEDGSHLAYQAANDEQIRESMGLAEVFFRTDNVNRASGEVARATTNEQEFTPDRKLKEFILNNTLIADMRWPGGPMSIARIQFIPPTVVDPLDKAAIDTMYAQNAALTVNEMRESQHLEPFDVKKEGFEWAEQPYEMHTITVGLAIAALQQGYVSEPIRKLLGDLEALDPVDGFSSGPSSSGVDNKIKSLDFESRRQERNANLKEFLDNRLKNDEISED